MLWLLIFSHDFYLVVVITLVSFFTKNLSVVFLYPREGVQCKTENCFSSEVWICKPSESSTTLSWLCAFPTLVQR